MANALLIAHAAATLFMLGVIWFVQLAHYPLLAEVGREAFPAYERRYTARMGWLVGPPMLLEALTAVALVVRPAPALPAPAAWAGLGLLAVVWASTGLLQVPCHGALERGFDAAAHRRLVRTNWVRTVAWSLRAALLAGGVVSAG